jgi:DNA-binding CsgD family transcriptional regulator
MGRTREGAAASVAFRVQPIAMTTPANDLILRMYRASREMDHARFRPWVFEELARIVALDSAFWYRWAATPDRSHLHAWWLYRQPDSLIHEYIAEGLWREDEAYARAVVALPGVAVRVPYDEYTSEKMRAFLRKNRQFQVMTVAIQQEIPRLASGFSFYRNETGAPFSDEDAALAEMLAPHVVEVWRENWLRDVVRKARSTHFTEFSLGVVMPDFMLSAVQSNFANFVLEEWPDWHGPWVPQPWAGFLSLEDSADPWVGRRIAAYARRQEDGTTLLLLRHAHPLDRLPRRKREAARLFSTGASQSEVAGRLRLSASTVNNYLADVYRDLRIRDKTELSMLVASLEP